MMKSVKKLKTDRINEDGLLLSENVFNGSYLLFIYVSLLFTVMLFHSFAPPDFVISSTCIIPKGARVTLTDSENCRIIAPSRLLSKIPDHIAIDHQVHF